MFSNVDIFLYWINVGVDFKFLLKKQKLICMELVKLGREGND